MVSAGRWRTVLAGGVAVACLVGLPACGAATGPEQPTAGRTTTAASPGPSSLTTSPPTASPLTTSPTPATSVSSPAGSGPTSTTTGVTLRELGFENGPDQLTLPADTVISTRVDQPNVVTVVLARPSPQTVENYLRATLPDEGFTIDARAAAGGAMTFEGNGWTGGFTGTSATSAIVLRPSS